MRRVLGMLVCVASLASCDWSTFDKLRNDASGVALGAPDGYPAPTFGAVVAGYDGVLGTDHVSRVVVGAGANAPIHVVPLWDGTGVDLGTPAFIGCRNAGDCDTGMGSAVAGIPEWRSTQQLCTVMGGATTGALDVHCEAGGMGSTEHIAGPTGVGFGAALAALPAGFMNGGVVVGAPTSGGTTGALYRMKDDASIAPIAVGSATTGAVSLGTRIAVAPLPSGDALVAATAPGMSTSRVVVLVLHTDGSADVRACLDDAHPGAAAAIALGDVDGDGAPDLAVGDDAATPSRRDSVQLFLGRDMPAATACGAWGAAATTVACPMGVRGIACGGSGFGAALAMGDVDADGKDELVVGAPAATVGDQANAGAVFLLRIGATTSPNDALTDSSPRAAAHLGQSVAVARSRGARSEVIAGAPGTNEAIVFLCSGLPNDGPSTGPRCIPAS